MSTLATVQRIEIAMHDVCSVHRIVTKGSSFEQRELAESLRGRIRLAEYRAAIRGMG